MVREKIIGWSEVIERLHAWLAVHFARTELRRSRTSCSQPSGILLRYAKLRLSTRAPLNS